MPGTRAVRGDWSALSTDLRSPPPPEICSSAFLQTPIVPLPGAICSAAGTAELRMSFYGPRSPTWACVNLPLSEVLRVGTAAGLRKWRIYGEDFPEYTQRDTQRVLDTRMLEVDMRVFQKKSLTAEAALEMVSTAVACAAQNEVNVAVAVVDESGIVKAFLRMDGAPLLAVEAARKKALTAVGFGMASGQPWADFIGTDSLLDRGVDSLTDFTMLPGGLPIFADEQLVGAIGVAGGHYRQDLVVAEYALTQDRSLTT
jgi:uncharacterized protein GlcG (DUF336 family)